MRQGRVKAASSFRQARVYPASIPRQTTIKHGAHIELAIIWPGIDLEVAQNRWSAKSAIRHLSSSLSTGSCAFSVFLQQIFTRFTRPIIKVSADEKEQVCLNKDASEGREEDRIAERY